MSSHLIIRLLEEEQAPSTTEELRQITERAKEMHKFYSTLTLSSWNQREILKAIGRVEATKLETRDVDEMDASWMNHMGFGAGGGGGGGSGDFAGPSGSVVKGAGLRALVRRAILDQFQSLRMCIRLSKWLDGLGGQ